MAAPRPAASLVARALALAAHRLALADGALARIAGRDGVAAVELARTMAAPGGAPLAERVRDELAAARPAHLELVHVTWIDAALAGEPPAVRAAITGGGDGPRQRWLARLFLGELVPMPDPVAPATGAAALVPLEPGLLSRALVLLGRRQLAHALGGGSPRALAELSSRLPWGKDLMTEVRGLLSLGDVEAQLGSRKRALARTTGLRWTESMAATRLGLRAIAPAVARVPDLAAQLAQRMSRPVGMLALAELAAHAVPDDGASDGEIARAIARATVAP